MTIKKFGVLISLFILIILSFTTGWFTQANAASSSTVLPVAKGGTGVNTMPANQVLYGNNQGQLIGKDIGKSVKLNITLLNTNFTSWNAQGENYFYGTIQDDNLISGFILIDAHLTIKSRGGNGIILAKLPEGYITSSGFQQYGVAFGQNPNIYIFWTETSDNTNNLLYYYDDFNTNIPLNTSLRVNYNSPLIIKKI
ncbi:MAG: hypothetical protein LBT99_03205 [Bifidobacteriaceae bacterium]|jgi:hypothetical protein|nr:hypothetical protein [Bifidobacteriaceae bacterium]